MCDRIADYLSKWFFVEKEVCSIDKGNKKRIDIVCVHGSDSKGEFPFGIEVKPRGVKKGREIGIWFKQAHRYTKYQFGSHGKLIVLVAPSISVNYFQEGEGISKHPDDHPHHNVSTFLGQFGIGEMKRFSKAYEVK